MRISAIAKNQIKPFSFINVRLFADMVIFYKCAKIGEKPVAGRGFPIFDFRCILQSMRLFRSGFRHQNLLIFSISRGRIGRVMLIGLFSLFSNQFAVAYNRLPDYGPCSDTPKTTSWFKTFFDAHPDLKKWVSANGNTKEVQLIYTRIDRGANGNALLQQEYYRVAAEKRFDPGQAAGLPLAILALERMSQLEDSVGIDKSNTLLIESGGPGLTAGLNDPTTTDGKPSLSNYLKRMLLVGDPEAYNRIFEFTGREYIRKGLVSRGYTRLELPARIGDRFSAAQNRISNPLIFQDDDLKVIYREPLRQAPAATNRGSDKNGAGLEDLHNLLVSLIAPSRFPKERRFEMKREDQSFLFHYMGLLPTESILPPYRDDSLTYCACLRKLLLCGGREGAPMPESLRIFNLSDTANGRLTDVAYFADTAAKVDFFLSATLIKKPGNVAEADSSLYFLRELGQAVYRLELKRPRRFPPDLKPYFSGYTKKQ
jgi:hypothetical protein